MTPPFNANGLLAATGPHNPGDSPVGRFLTHPSQILARLTHAALSAAAGYGPWAGPLLLAATAAALGVRVWLRRRQHAAFTAGARTITVLAPPQADPAGGEALWGNLAGLMRPPWARLWHGQPHLGWEYTWTTTGMAISLWVPCAVPPGMAERAVEAAWPGAHTLTTPATPPLPESMAATGGTLRLARPEILPLKTDHGADPLRAGSGRGRPRAQ